MIHAPSPPRPADSLSERFTQIVDAMGRVAAAKASRYWALAPVVLLLWSYLKRLARRFDSLALRRRAPVPRPRSPRAVSTQPPPARRLPQGFAWLRLFGPEMGALGSQLRHLLAEPEMTALLEEAPQAGRLLRPLCRMLGIGPGPDVPPALVPPTVRPARFGADQGRGPLSSAVDQPLPTPILPIPA